MECFSYLEIYNEKVKDLLVAKDGLLEPAGYSTLKVREHPRKGPYVQGKIRMFLEILTLDKRRSFKIVRHNYYLISENKLG